MANTFKFGNGNWAVKDGYALAYNDENNNFKPLPFDFTRASSATRVNKQGLIETVPSGKPRIDFTDNTSGHLLLEPSRTNSLPYSLEYDNNTYYTKTNSTITTQSGVSPDGSNTAYKLQDTNDSGATSHYIQQASGYRATITYNAIKSGSVFVKAGTKNQVQVRLVNGSGSFSYIMGNFDLETETILTGASANASDISYELQNYGNGWYRCIVKGSWTLSNVTQTALQVFIADSSLAALPNIHNYQGDGTGNLFVWGQMIEAGSYATSYIPTEGSSVTRVAETANDAGNSTVFNDSEGVLFFETATLANDSTFRNICISDSSTSDKIQFYYYGNNNNIAYVIVSASSTQASDNTKTLSNALEFNKIAIKYKQNDFAVWVNGTEVSIDSSGNTPTGLKEFAFDDGNGGSPFYGKVKDLKVYNTALTDTELQNLTS
jgi:hypothetical protein